MNSSLWGLFMRINLEGSVFFFFFLPNFTDFLRLLKEMEMKKMYESPKLEVIEVCVESGYGTSGGSTTEDYVDGGTIIL